MRAEILFRLKKSLRVHSVTNEQWLYTLTQNFTQISSKKSLSAVWISQRIVLTKYWRLVKIWLGLERQICSCRADWGSPHKGFPPRLQIEFQPRTQSVTYSIDPENSWKTQSSTLTHLTKTAATKSHWTDSEYVPQCHCKIAVTYKRRSDEVRLKADSKLVVGNSTPVMLLLTSEISCNLETFCIDGRFKVPEILLRSKFLSKRNNIINMSDQHELVIVIYVKGGRH